MLEGGGGQRDPDPKITGLKTWNPEVLKLKEIQIPTSRNLKKEYPEPERFNPEIWSLKTTNPNVSKKVLPPHLITDIY